MTRTLACVSTRLTSMSATPARLSSAESVAAESRGEWHHTYCGYVKNPANGAAESGVSDSVTPLLQLLVDSTAQGAAAAVAVGIGALRCCW
jgi:hypothetical protein